MTPEDFEMLLRSRRSRRHFTARAVEFEKLERALTAAMRAPSGANAQPWEYVLIERGPVREQVRKLCEKADTHFHITSPAWLRTFFDAHDITPVKDFCATAPYLVAVFGHRNLPFWLQSVWLSIANFITALEIEGVHSLTYTPSLGKDFNRLLGVDEEWSCQAVLPIGYGEPDEVLKPRPRKSPAEKVHVVDGEGALGPFKSTLPFQP